MVVIPQCSYFHILGVCMTYKMGFGFDQIYWTFMQLVTTFHKSLSSTEHTLWPHYINPLLFLESESHCDWWTVSKSWWFMTRYLLLWQLWSCFCGVPSLTRGLVCLLYMLLALASAVFCGSESLGTRNHILLSRIWDFPFGCLRLAGSSWRYSTPPPHGFLPWVKVTLRLTVGQSVSLGVWPDIYYCLTVTVLLLWGAFSDERTGLSFVRVNFCSSKSFVIM
jgi:hypothetical protein